MEQNGGSVMSILDEQNFDLGQIDEQIRWLDLSKFDNKKFEIFDDPSQLFRLFSLDSTDTCIPIWADILVKSYKTGEYSWRRARVLEHMKTTNKWHLDLGENPDNEFYYDGLNQVTPSKIEALRQQKRIFADRICFCFDFEDKRQFAERFADANLDRAFKDSSIRYSFYVDAMPKNAHADQPVQRKKRLMDRILRIKTDPEEGGAQLDTQKWRAQIMKAFFKIYPNQEEDFFLEQVDSIDNECQDFYSRSVNRVIFDNFCRKDDKGLISKQKLLLPVEEYLPPAVPDKGLIETMTAREYELEQSVLRKNKSLGLVGVQEKKKPKNLLRGKKSFKKMKSTFAKNFGEKKVKFAGANDINAKENRMRWRENQRLARDSAREKQSKSAEDCIERLGSGQFQSRKSCLENIFLFKDRKAQHIIRLLNDRSITLRKNHFFCEEINEPLNYFSFKVLQEKYTNKFKDFLRVRYHKELNQEIKRTLTSKETVEIKQTKDILKNLLPKNDIQSKSKNGRDEEDEAPKFKIVNVLKPKYEGLLKLVNMKMKQELEQVMVLGFGRFLRFLDSRFPSSLEVKSLRQIEVQYKPSPNLEFCDEEDNHQSESVDSNGHSSVGAAGHVFQPCLVSLFLNKLRLDRTKEVSKTDLELDLKKLKSPAESTINGQDQGETANRQNRKSKTDPYNHSNQKQNSDELTSKPQMAPPPLFQIETIIHENEIRILEEPGKFVKLVKLMFEKNFREFYKIKMIKFNLEPSAEKSLVNRAMIRGLRCSGQSDLTKNEFFFEDRTASETLNDLANHSSERAKMKYYSKKRTEDDGISNFWFDRNRKIILIKLRKNARKVKMYVGLLKPLEKLIKFDFRKYLKELEKSQQETVESLMQKIDTCKKEILEIEEKYPTEIVIGTFRLNIWSLVKKVKERKSSVIKGMLQMISDKGKGGINIIIEKVRNIKARMRISPENIESLFELKNKLDSQIDAEIKSLRSEILAVRAIFERLEEQHYQADSDDLTRLWKLFCLPEELLAHKDTKIEELEKIKGIFFVELMDQKNDFTDQIGETENEIQTLYTYKNVDDLEDVSIKIQTISLRLSDLEAKVNVFNKRERLLDRPITDYSIIGKLKKSFKVHCDLWQVIRSWIEYKEQTTAPSGFEEIQKRDEFLKKLISKLNSFLTHFNEMKSKNCLQLIEMIEIVKSEIILFTDRKREQSEE